ncbi:hypothetical protein EDD18DRAFT_1106046 [Armillaria luteobubalina]|uniref:Uncharacterized protein n=1 Tax=Armillaria luteobubalina TaxID=153913 RepID=A0AA39UT20_9AGAR|nr:hypothetical protein EDD18DRAFT_1106046 [Armillaria luteobubalina]
MGLNRVGGKDQNVVPLVLSMSIRDYLATAALSMSHISPPSPLPESTAQPTMNAVESTFNKRILPEYDPTRPLDEDLPDDEDNDGFGDDGDGHGAPSDDEDGDLPSSIHPPPGWLMASFKANLQVVKDSVIGHGASTKVTICQFPAHLTHHSGMSDSVLTLMRCCFQNGMGAKQFSDSLRVLHRHRYEMLEVEYLQTIESRARASPSLCQTYEPFPLFNDKTERGLNTIVPSAQWCHDVYDNFIEAHEHEYHQHTVILSGEVLAIDHSFKPCIIFTDFIGDKKFLEESFPSLRAGIRPITQHGDLEMMELPSQVKIVVQKSTSQIEAMVLSLITSMPDDEESVLIVGLDSEWSVDLDARRLGLNDCRQTAIVQLAYKDTIWIFQIA